MAGEADEIEVLALEFDEVNEDHLALHDLDPSTVRDVLAGAPRFFRNLPDRAGSHAMIGPDGRGRIWFVALQPTTQAGVRPPITGWPAGRKLRRLYLSSEVDDERQRT